MLVFLAIVNIKLACLENNCKSYSKKSFILIDLYSCRFFYTDSFWTPFVILETMEVPGFITYYVFIAALTCGFLLIGLVLWHGRMIGRGQTSLERVLNNSYGEQCYEQGFVFVNPYDFGFRGNWKRFLGFQTKLEFVRRVLLPSTHKPIGDGVTWDGYNVNANLKLYKQPYGQLPRPIAYPPDFNPNYSVGRPIMRRPTIVPPWENQNNPNHTSAVYKPTASSTETIESSKDR